MVQRSIVVTAAFVAGALTLPVATAAAPTYRLTSSPSLVGLRQAVTLTLRAPAPRPGAHYEVLLRTRATGPACSSGPRAYLRLDRIRRGVFRLRVRPDTPPETDTVWCGDAATARVRRAARRGAHTRTLAKLTVRIGERPAPEPAPATTLVSLLAGGTLTARASGRPDRTTPLTGEPLRGVTTSILPWPVTIEQLRGTLSLPSLAPDPVLCPFPSPVAEVDVLPASRLELARRNALDLVLNRSPAQIFGCGPAGAPNGTTTIRLSGESVADPETGSIIGSSRTTLTGSVTGLKLPGDATGQLDVRLILGLDTSGRP